MEIIILGSLLFIGWLFWWWNDIWFLTPVKRRSSSLNLKMFPGSLGLPHFGEMLSFLWYFKVRRSPDDFIRSKIRKYGEGAEAYRSHLYGHPSIIVCSPSLSKLVLNSQDNFKMAWPTSDVTGPNSVLSLEGAHHAKMKNLIKVAINHPPALARIALRVQPIMINSIQSWAQKGKIEAVDELKKMSLLNMGKYFVSLDFGPQRDAIEQMLHAITLGFRAQPSKIPGSTYDKAVKSRNKFRSILRVELEKRKLERTEESEGAKDLMDELMRTKDEEGNNLTDEEVLDNVISSIHVGSTSNAYLQSWALYFLAQHPHVLQKLREENMKLADEKKGEFITYEDVSKLKYTNKVVEETIRLSNSSGFVFRKAVHDIEYKGYLIPKDWKVIVWIRYLHVDPANYDNPLCFNPDRWDTKPRLGTYYVFGGGWKSCPGSMLVRLQLAILLHHLSVGYKWDLINQDVKIRYLSHPCPENLKLFFSEI